MKTALKITALLVIIQFFAACASTSLPKLEPVDSIELDRFMGDWYVIAFIPIFVEKHATNAIENYSLREDGDVDITYTFHKDSTDGEMKKFEARAFVPEDGKYSEWRVQFFWPIKFPYLVIDVAEDYSYTVIGVPNRKNLWIMAREPNIPNGVYEKILKDLEEKGYDTSLIKIVPQEWDNG